MVKGETHMDYQLVWHFYLLRYIELRKKAHFELNFSF